MEYFPRNRVFLLLTALLVPALISCSGCSSDPGKSPDEDKPNFHRYDQPVHPKKAAELTLVRAVSQKNYTVGKQPQGTPAQKLSIRISNNNLETVTIKEWRPDETLNLRISIAEPSKAPQWRQVWPAGVQQPEKANVKHYIPITLAPGNSLLIDLPMTFLETFDLRGEASKVLMVKVELNLTSAVAAPLVFEIRVRAKQPKKVREIIITD